MGNRWGEGRQRNQKKLLALNTYSRKTTCILGANGTGLLTRCFASERKQAGVSGKIDHGVASNEE